MFHWLTAALEARRATATHEAGHVVVAYRLGFDVGPVSIRSNGAGLLGWSFSEGPSIDRRKDEPQIITPYAGLAAERLVNPNADAASADDDYERAAALLPFVARDQATLEADAARLVVQYRAQIEAVADALFAAETLQDDTPCVIMDAVAAGEDWRSVLAGYLRFRAAAAAPSR